MKTSLFTTFLLISSFSYAQDQLFKKDNTKIEAKILEINPTEIKYKLFTYQDGPTITISKKDVALIIYQNGLHEVIQSPPEPVVEAPLVRYRDAGRRGSVREKPKKDSAAFAALVSTKNLVFLNILSPLNGSLELGYFREFMNNYVNVYVPVSVGFTNPVFNDVGPGLVTINSNYYYNVSNYKLTRKVIDAGLGIHFQTSGGRAVTHFIGPYIGFSQFNGSFNDNLNYPYYTGSASLSHSFVMNRMTWMLDNGFLFRPNKSFNIILMASVGHQEDTYLSNDPQTFNYGNVSNYYSNTSFPLNAFKLSLSMGYRF